MATGTFPFASADDIVVRRLVAAGKLARPEQIGSEFSKLYETMTRIAPKQRPTADFIVNSPCLTVEKEKNQQIVKDVIVMNQF
jgi:hypothetical protein